jgi:hypothetical protein
MLLTAFLRDGYSVFRLLLKVGLAREKLGIDI